MRIVLFIHGDSDGVVSGALAYKYYELTRKNSDIRIVFTHPAGLASDLREFAKPGDIVFIADIALSEQHLEKIEKLFKQYSSVGELVYIDHHPEPLGIKPSELSGYIIHDTCCSASELVYRLFGEELGWEYSRVGLYGAIGDYLDNTKWVLKTLRDWDKRTIYFEAGVLTQGLEGSRKMYDFKRHVVKHLAENKLPSSLSELLVRALIESVRDEGLREWVRIHVKTHGSIAYVLDPPGSVSKAATYARSYAGKIVGLAGHKHKNMYVFSLRAVGDIDLNRILREITPSLGGTGGGHPHAAGARIPINKFDEFLEKLDEALKHYLY